MVEGVGLWAQKWCEFKPLLTTPQSCAHIVSVLRVGCGQTLGTKPHPDLEGSVNKSKY
jgi:hypothetical protein